LRRISGDRHPQTADALYELALMLRSANHFADSELAARNSWQSSRKLFSATNEVVLKAFWLLASTTSERGDLSGADALLVEAPLDAIAPDWGGRTVAGEWERFWLIRTLTALAWHHQQGSKPASARRYARYAQTLAEPLLLMREQQTGPAWQ